jgi:hypothetical protein
MELLAGLIAHRRPNTNQIYCALGDSYVGSEKYKNKYSQRESGIYKDYAALLSSFARLHLIIYLFSSAEQLLTLNF